MEIILYYRYFMIRTASILFVLQSEIFNYIQYRDFFDEIIRLKKPILGLVQKQS